MSDKAALLKKIQLKFWIQDVPAIQPEEHYLVSMSTGSSEHEDSTTFLTDIQINLYIAMWKWQRF